MDAKTLAKVAADCQQLAGHFANRQNRETTLTPKEAQEIVTRSLNAGNLLEQIVRQLNGTETPKEQT